MREYPKTLTVGVTRQTTYELCDDILLVEFAPEADDERIADVVGRGRYGRLERCQTDDRPTFDERQLRAARLHCVRAAEKPDGLADLSSKLVAGEDVVTRATPIYTPVGRGDAHAATPLLDTFIVRLSDGAAPTAASDIAVACGLAAHPERAPRRPEYAYFSSEAARADVEHALAALDCLRGRPEVAWAEFDWIALAPYQSAPDDTYWPRQWNLVRINALLAWSRPGPLSNVAVAVIDDNVQRDHPDLPPIPPAKQLDLGSPTQPEGATPTEHGTAMAGIIAARRNNLRGVAGLVGACDLHSVRLALAPPWSKVAEGLFWAADQGARVISISLGALGTSEYVSEAIEYAWQRGAVICAASGSHGGAQVDFPASHPRVIAVGATDPTDRRKTLASGGGTTWESQYGPELAVMAPGVDCWTTDETGPRGDNPGGAALAGDPAGDYTKRGSGTSIATPHVAGLAALILMHYPDLTNEEVREAIERTCAKVHPETYGYADAKPHGGWSEEMGYGLIDCDAALRYAAQLRPGGQTPPGGAGGCVYAGYPGPSARPDYLRLYCAPDLVVYLELCRDDIVAIAPDPRPAAGSPRMLVSMRRGATVQRVATSARRV